MERTINLDLLNVKEWLLANKLSLNIVKTEYLLIGSPHNIKHLSSEPNVCVGNESIERVQVTKALGVAQSTGRLMYKVLHNIGNQQN